MGKLVCCFLMFGKKNKSKVEADLSRTDLDKSFRSRKLRLEQPLKPFEGNSVDFSILTYDVPEPIVKKDSRDDMVNRTFVQDDPVERAYEGEDEHEENASMKRDLSDLDLYGRVANSGDEDSKLDYGDKYFVTESDKDNGKSAELIHTGHVSDPGIGKVEFLNSPKLKRSCSNLETSKVLRKLVDPSNPTCRMVQDQHENSVPGSPISVVSHRSADRVILKKQSSSQILPSRSRKLWWKLFLWSHRNLHKNSIKRPQPQAVNSALNQQGGYYSDTLEPNQASPLSNVQSNWSFTEESSNKGQNDAEDKKKRWDSFHNSGFWPQNQWVAFSVESTPYTRVDEWVRDLETQPSPLNYNCDEYDGEVDEKIVFPPSPDNGRLPSNTGKFIRRPHVNLSEEILYANTVIQSLNSSSTVAHISGISLKAIPLLSQFASLRSINLSNNSIAHITPGSLPKGLHTLNLSRNKISAIEGLRELTRLRVLDLSYNRISRIGQGLSNCTVIKELYLAGNKISEVEGLHRLLKLAVLDLSFNKMTTSKALGQLVANYGSLQALNLLGNPILNNTSDDQLRKTICSLLPKLVYLSKQSIKPQRAREILTDSVARAALWNGSSFSSRKRTAKRGITSSSSSNINRSVVSSRNKSKNKAKSDKRTNR